MKKLIVDGILHLIAYFLRFSFALLMTLLIYFYYSMSCSLYWFFQLCHHRPFVHSYFFLLLLYYYYYYYLINNLTSKQAPSRKNRILLLLLPPRVCIICLEFASYLGFTWVLCWRKKNVLIFIYYLAIINPHNVYLEYP